METVVSMATEVVSEFLKQEAIQRLCTAVHHTSSATVVLLAVAEAAGGRGGEEGAGLLERCRQVGEMVGGLVAALRQCQGAPGDTHRELELITTAQAAVVVSPHARARVRMHADIRTHDVRS